MTAPTVDNRYGWVDAKPTCAHAYLLPAVEAALGRFGAQRTRVLDIGCGNGAMARHLADLGFEVTALEVVEHLYHPRKLFVAARQCLKPGGTLVVSTPYHGYLKNLALAIAGAWDTHLTAAWDGGHIKFFSRRTLNAMAAEAGFREIGFQGAGRLPYLRKSMVVSYRNGA